VATVYAYVGKGPDGKEEKGEITAGTKDEAQRDLQNQGIIVSKIGPKEKKGFFGPKKGGKVDDKDIVVFTRQFSTMIDAGLPLVQALDILASQAENPSLRKVLAVIKNDVESGATFADALKKHPDTFTSLYANMVAAGETGGILDTILQRLAGYIEKSMKLKKQIKAAMVYPITISSVAMIVVGVILVFVVPVFQDMFASLGGQLPLPTQIIVVVSNFLKGGGAVLLIGGIFAFKFAMKKIRKTEKGLFITDNLALKIPIVGDLIRKVSVSKFTRTMGTLTSSGVPILEGLDITARTSGNKVIEKAILQVRAAVSEGKTLAEPLQKSGAFPDMVTHMIAVGEQTGALDIMMSKIADFYDDEVDNAVAGMTAAMEPIMMVFLGVTVGFIVIAMYLPIFKLITLV
jgi:type IV pilus assembly protein PilC